MTGVPEKTYPVLPTREPRLEVGWAGGAKDFLGKLLALLAPLPLLPPGSSFVAFRGAFLERRRPRQALLLSLTLHILFLVTPMPEFLTRPPARPAGYNTVRIEYDLQWTGTSRLLPPISPAPPPAREPSPREQQEQPLPPPGAERVAPQTIVSSPPQPNHPRQTLLQQFGLDRTGVQAPEMQLPNMVIPSAPAPAAEVNLRRLRIPGAPLDLTGPPHAPMPARPKSDAELALENMQLENLLPRLAVAPSAAGESEAAPEVEAPVGPPRSGDLPAPGVLALSADPAVPGPVLELPDTNLRARFAVGPNAGSGSPGGVPGGIAVAEGVSGGTPASLSAPHILVTAAGAVPPGPVIVGPESSPSPPEPPPAPVPPAPPEPQIAAEIQFPPGESAQERAQALMEGISPGTHPGAGAPWQRVYTIYINMPNLTSQTGSWVLLFAELGDWSSTAAGGAGDGYPLSAPVPIKKVDPKYPAAARRSRVEGTVSLYAIIRPDGSVQNVEVVRSLHALLDQSAVAAFRRWHFQPGHKNGQAVPLEVVVEIPFRLNKLF